MAQALRLREDSVLRSDSSRSRRAQWDSSTKLDAPKKPHKSPKSKQCAEPPPLPQQSPLKEDDDDDQARELIERAFQSAWTMATTPLLEEDKPNLLKELRGLVDQDQRVQPTEPKASTIQEQLDQLLIEKTKRKLAIHSFRQRLHQQMLRLEQIDEELSNREALLDAAYDKYTQSLQH